MNDNQIGKIHFQWDAVAFQRVFLQEAVKFFSMQLNPIHTTPVTFSSPALLFRA